MTRKHDKGIAFIMEGEWERATAFWDCLNKDTIISAKLLPLIR